MTKKLISIKNSINSGRVLRKLNMLILRSKKVDLLLVFVRLILSHQLPLVLNVCYFIMIEGADYV